MQFNLIQCRDKEQTSCLAGSICDKFSSTWWQSDANAI